MYRGLPGVVQLAKHFKLEQDDQKEEKQLIGDDLDDHLLLKQL